MKNILLSLLNYRKVGGLHFARIGSLSVSFCLTKKRPAKRITNASFEPLPTFRNRGTVLLRVSDSL
jgi:hypothetical protein